MAAGDDRQWIEVLDPGNLPEDIDREIAHLRRDPNYSRLIEAVIGQVSQIAPGRRNDALLHGLDLVEQLMVATNRTAWESAPLERSGKARAAPYGYWRHVDELALGGPHHGPSIRIDDALDIAATYLLLPFRVEELDRQILDMLLAAHISEFVDANEQLLISGNSALNPIWTKNMAPIIGVGLLWGGLWLAPMVKPLAIICGLVSLGLAALALQFGYQKTHQKRWRALKALESLRHAYSALAHKDGNLSEFRNYVRLARTADRMGLAGLSALIEDILMRRPNR